MGSNLFEDSYFISSEQSSINMTTQSPLYDSLLSYWTVTAQILPSGGSAIIEKGFCLSLDPNPTVFDQIFPFDGGNESFSVYLYNGGNIEPNTNYYIRSYATSEDGISYSNVENFSSTSKNSFQVGDFAFGGILYQYDGEHGFVALINDLNDLYIWGCEGQNLTCGSGITNDSNENAGIINTNEIYQCCQENNSAGVIAYNYEANGFDDWYLPSPHEFQIMYEVIGVEDNIGNFIMDSYWTSLEAGASTAYDYYVVDHGLITASSTTSKGSERYVRLIRSF